MAFCSSSSLLQGARLLWAPRLTLWGFSPQKSQRQARKSCPVPVLLPCCYESGGCTAGVDFGSVPQHFMDVANPAALITEGKESELP